MASMLFSALYTLPDIMVSLILPTGSPFSIRNPSDTLALNSPPSSLPCPAPSNSSTMMPFWMSWHIASGLVVPVSIAMKDVLGVGVVDSARIPGLQIEYWFAYFALFYDADASSWYSFVVDWV